MFRYSLYVELLWFRSRAVNKECGRLARRGTTGHDLDVYTWPNELNTKGCQ